MHWLVPTWFTTENWTSLHIQKDRKSRKCISIHKSYAFQKVAHWRIMPTKPTFSGTGLNIFTENLAVCHWHCKNVPVIVHVFTCLKPSEKKVGSIVLWHFEVDLLSLVEDVSVLYSELLTSTYLREFFLCELNSLGPLSHLQTRATTDMSSLANLSLVNTICCLRDFQNVFCPFSIR